MVPCSKQAWGRRQWFNRVAMDMKTVVCSCPAFQSESYKDSKTWSVCPLIKNNRSAWRLWSSQLLSQAKPSTSASLYSLPEKRMNNKAIKFPAYCRMMLKHWSASLTKIWHVQAKYTPTFSIVAVCTINSTYLLPGM